VTILEPSGNAALDAVAMDHIRRTAPFPAPPDGVAANFSFEFVGK
jgi:periplasmic protein TonB